MKSSEAIFTRQDPFPPEPVLARAHYNPSRAKKVSKQQRKLVLNPVRLGPEPSPQSAPLCLEDQNFSEGFHHAVLCSPSESWPSTDCAESQALFQLASGTREPSVLAKYIERFRYGTPQSRKERQRLPAGGANVQPFWWMSSSPPNATNSTPTQESKEHFSEPVECRSGDVNSSAEQTSLSPTRDLLDLSVLALSDSSHCETGEPEILQLQERASRLLQKSENSLSSMSSSVPVSSEGLGCSDFSSPGSADEPVRRPMVSRLMDSKLQTTPISSGTYPLPASSALGTRVSKPCPEDDILFQWRLRRKMEQARQWSQTSSHRSSFHQPLWSSLAQQPSTVSADPPQRSGFSLTPVCIEGTECVGRRAPCPALIPTCPATFCKLHPETSIHTCGDCITCSHSLLNPYPARERATLNPRGPCVLPQAHQLVQSSSSETSVEPYMKHEAASSPSPQASESIEEEWHSCQHEEKTQARDRPHIERGGKRVIASIHNKKTDRLAGSGGVVRRKQRIPSASDGGQTGVNHKITTKSHSRGQSLAGDIQSGDRVPPPSPIHSTLEQVVSEVLFPSTDSPRTPCSSEPHRNTPMAPSPPQSPAPPPQPSEVIDQLMQEAQDSDELEFADDPLLLVLRQQRKWVKEQLGEVDWMLDKL